MHKLLENNCRISATTWCARSTVNLVAAREACRDGEVPSLNHNHSHARIAFLSDYERPFKTTLTQKSKKQGKRRVNEQNSSESSMSPNLDLGHSPREKFSQTSRSQDLKLHAFISILTTSQQNRSTGSRDIIIFVK